MDVASMKEINNKLKNNIKIANTFADKILNLSEKEQKIKINQISNRKPRIGGYIFTSIKISSS